jgi:hypothetical protein
VSYKICKSCGQPVLKKGQVRKSPHEYRHASGCPEDDAPKPVRPEAESNDAQKWTYTEPRGWTDW